MPHSVPFVKTEMDTNSTFSSQCYGSSTYEPAMPIDEQNDYFSRCRWYGEQFYHFGLSMAIFKNAAQTSNGSDLKSELDQAVIDFPYAATIEKLDGVKTVKLPGDVSGAAHTKSYTTFVTKLGAIAEQADSNIRNSLTYLIQSRGGSMPVRPNGEDMSCPPSPSSDDAAIAADRNIPMYTMKLSEWATKYQKNMGESAKQLSVDPPLWEVRLLIEGETFVGQAKKQKMAKHLASKQACEKLDIEV